MAEGIVQFTTDIINDSQKTTKTTYSSDKIEKLLSNLSGVGTEVILGCFDSTATPSNIPTTFVKDDQYYDKALNKIFKATSNTTWDSGNTPTEDVLYASIDDNKIYAYIKGVWSIYGGNDTKISTKTNNIVSELTGQTNKNENGIYVPLSKKTGNIIDNLSGQTTDTNNGLFIGKSAKTLNAIENLTGQTNSAENGLYVEDLNPKINLLDATTKLNKDGVQEYLFLIGKQKKTTTTQGASDVNPNVVIAVKGINDIFYLMRNENLETTITDTDRYNFSTKGTTVNTGSYIVLKAGITYKIKANILSTCNGSYFIFDEDGNAITSRGYSGIEKYTDTPAVGLVKFDKDTKVYCKFYTTSISSTTTSSNDAIFYSGCSSISIEAMSYLAIDPLQYIDNNNGTQDTPVGTIISVMGNKAPKHYLICDGQTDYLIKDYPYLSQYIKEEFKKVNYFGGDGVTTFRTPDLRGEFLRGTGTNGHANQGNGADVGTHQDATEIPFNYGWGNTFGILESSNSLSDFNAQPAKWDSGVKAETGYRQVNANFAAQTSTNPATYTARPTNTSILYCIKAEPTYFINVIGTTTETELLDTPTIPTQGSIVTLNDKFTNYDKIKFIYKSSHSAAGNLYMSSAEYDVKDLVIDASGTTGINSIVITSPSLDAFNFMAFNFKDDSTIEVTYLKPAGSAWKGIYFHRIVGIKTSSVVQGGSFGTGSGNGNPNCDCGKVTTTDMTNAIKDVETELDK